MYTFRTLTLDEFDSIKYTAESPSNEVFWIRDWFSVFKNVENNVLGYSKKPYIIGAYREDKLVAVVPLIKLVRVYFKYIRIEFLEFLGQQWSCMGNDIHAFEEVEENLAVELTRWVRKNISYHFLFLKYLPKKSLFANRFKLLHYAGAPYLQVDKYADYEDFAKQVYSRKFREELRRTARKIKRDGFEFEVTFEKITEKNLEQIKEVAKSKEVDGKSFLYGNSSKEAFHLQVYKSFPSNILLLKLNKQVVAYETSIDWHGGRIGMDSSFDRTYRKYGIGIHCVDIAIRNSFKDKKKKLSFGLGLDMYKLRFADQIQQYFMCIDFKYRLKAILALPYFYYLLKKKEQGVMENFQKAHGNG